MPKCSFCQKQYELPRGLTLVNVAGKIFYFCSSKCRKNFEGKRKKKKWTVQKQEEIIEAELAQQAEEQVARETETSVEEETKAEEKIEKNKEEKPEKK